MAITFKNKEAEAKVLQLIRDSGSKDRSVSEPAQAAFASVISSSLSQVLDPLSTAGMIFDQVIRFTGDTPPEIPIDTYFGIGEGTFRIWSNGVAGGLAYNEISGSDNWRFRTSKIDSAIAWSKRYARDSRLDVVQKGIDRLLGEVLVKSDFRAWEVLAKALGNAVTGGKSHVIASTAKTNSTARKFQLDDVNRLMTKIKRLNSSWANGSPAGRGSGLTDLFLSPEAMEEIRKMTYNPMNVSAIPDTNESTALGLPEEMRMEVYRSGGLASIYGKTLHELNELGVGQVYNELIRRNYTQTADGPAWTTATDEIILGIDASVGAFARCINADENNATFQMLADDQHFNRSDKMGYYGSQEEGWVVGNDKAIVGILW